MKFLVDANLPPNLCLWLRDRGHEAEHLVDLNLLTASDTEIWNRGRRHDLVIVSKDVDFYDRALVFGAPPKVLHVAVGNCSNEKLFEILDHAWINIEVSLSTGSLVSIAQEKIEMFP